MLSLFLVFSPSAQPLRLVVFDGYQKLHPLERESLSQPVAIVVIDEDAIARYGQWPWPRTRIAELFRSIIANQPAAIGVDLFFPEPDRFSPGAIADEMPILPSNLGAALRAMPSNDQRVAEAIRGNNVVMGIADASYVDPRFPNPPKAAPVITAGERWKNIHSVPGWIGSVDVIDRAAAGRGLMSSGPQDQVVRRAPLLARVQGTLVPSLALETVRVAAGTGIRIDDAPGGLLSLRIGREVATRLQDDGTTWMRYSTYESGKDRIVSAFELMSGKADPERIRNKLVLVGISGLGVLDFKTTPLGEFVPGVAIHAQEIENLFNGVYLVRPELAPRIEAVAFLVCGLILVFFVPRMSALQGIHLALGLVILLFGGAFLAFYHLHMLFDFAWPAIGTVAVFTSTIVGTLSEAERQRRVLRDAAARMAGEVDAARRIQMGLLPDPQETLGEDRRFQLAALLEPARTVGGDFYDFFMIDERRLFFVAADVSGKGLPAALFMASVKSHIKSAALRGGQVGEVLIRAQEEITRENPEQLFVTCFAAVLDTVSGDLEFSNAGHEPPFVRTPHGARSAFLPPAALRSA